jgi:diguanylate cyclase (GGDEF)-like protein
MIPKSKERSMKILVCEDNAALREGTARLIRGWGHDAHTVADGTAAVSAIQHERWDLILSDLQLPGDVDGLQILRTLRTVDDDAAFVISTGRDSAEIAVEAMSAGAFDYLIKPVTADRLWRVIESIRDRGAMLHRLRLVERDSLTDQLTAVGNYRAVHGALDMLLAEHTERASAVAIADVDHFRLLNDTLGHVRSDEILQHVGAALAAAVEPGDIVARLSSDQFMVVMPGANADRGYGTMERIRTAVESIEVQGGSGLPIPVSITNGIGLWPADGPTKVDLLRSIDVTLRQAKRAGGNRTTVHGPDAIPAVSLRSLSALTGLVQALDSRDHYTHLHSEQATRQALRVAEAIHDQGKIVVPDAILRKPGSLTPDEWAQMRQHSSIGAVIAATIPDLDGMVDIIRHHHERWDGDGYPAGIAGDDISRVVRIFSLGDAFSAMVTNRPYRKALGLEQALEQIDAGTGTQFDPDLTRAFLGVSWDALHLALSA